MALIDKIRALLATEDEEVVEDEETIDDVLADDAPVEDAPAEDALADDAPADDAPAEGAPADDAPAEGAPADEAPADVDALRETIRTMGAKIETYRNMLAEAGIEVDTVDERVEDETDELDESPTEDAQVEAFDTDAEERKAQLAEMTGRK